MRTIDRRRILKSGAAAGASLALGAPAISRAQPAAIKIGHLTPLTGFLGALGNYAQLGIKLAEEEINKAGGVLGRPIEVVSEDSINPSTAATKAQRMLDAAGAVMLLGEINSASARAIMQVADQNKRLFMSIGARSDVLRGKDCNRVTFHVDIPVTVMVNAAGQALLREGYVRGKKIYSITSDYLFGHDLAKVAKAYYAANGGTSVGDDLVPTDANDFSSYLVKIRHLQPDLVSTNLGGNQVANFVKQYAEFGIKHPVAGFNLNTADAWAAGEGNLSGIWPTVWHHDLDVPASKAFVAAFMQKHAKPPENHAWIEYITLKIVAQAITETKSTETKDLIEYLEKEPQFDILKARKAYFRSWDHQLMQEAYPLTVKPKGQAKDKWDFLALGKAVPEPDKPLDSLAPTRAQSECKL